MVTKPQIGYYYRSSGRHIKLEKQIGDSLQPVSVGVLYNLNII